MREQTVTAPRGTFEANNFRERRTCVSSISDVDSVAEADSEGDDSETDDTVGRYCSPSCTTLVVRSSPACSAQLTSVYFHDSTDCLRHTKSQ